MAETDSTAVRQQLDQLFASIDETARCVGAEWRCGELTLSRSKSQRVRQSLGSASTLIVAS